MNPDAFVFPYAGRHLCIIPNDDSTHCLLYDRVNYTPDAVRDFIELLRPHLNATLRSPKFIKEWGSNQRLKHPMCGACVPATQAVFYAFDTDNLVPHRGVDDDGMTHWWCKDKITGDVIDATATQYTDNDLLPPYEGGASADWYGWGGNAQIRSLRLLNRVLCDSQMYEVDGDDYTPPGVLPV
jgi:hypothetical protein